MKSSSLLQLFWALLLSILVSVECHVAGGCVSEDHARCVKMADPLISDPHLIFPDNIMDIDRVCRTWSKFVDCIKSYIDNCFTESRRHAFNQAVEVPVDSVHQMCTSTQYQTEYLQHATCLKSTLIENSHCGLHYRMMANQVQGREMARDALCCSYNRFRDCVLSETSRVCDPKVSPASKMLASAFSKQVLDKALSFLRDQCTGYSPNSGECVGYQPPVEKWQSQDSPVLPQQQPTVDPAVAWMPSSRDGRRKTTESKTTTTTTTASSWATNTLDLDNDSLPNSRSSYGRGVTWTSSSINNNEDIFKATHYTPSTEAWYPGAVSAGDHLSNDVVEHFNAIEVDEPNQQGLSHFGFDGDNGGVSKLNSLSNVLMVSLVTVLCYLFL